MRVSLPSMAPSVTLYARRPVPSSPRFSATEPTATPVDISPAENGHMFGDNTFQLYANGTPVGSVLFKYRADNGTQMSLDISSMVPGGYDKDTQKKTFYQASARLKLYAAVRAGLLAYQTAGLKSGEQGYKGLFRYHATSAVEAQAAHNFGFTLEDTGNAEQAPLLASSAGTFVENLSPYFSNDTGVGLSFVLPHTEVAKRSAELWAKLLPDEKVALQAHHSSDTGFYSAQKQISKRLDPHVI